MPARASDEIGGGGSTIQQETSAKQTPSHSRAVGEVAQLFEISGDGEVCWCQSDNIRHHA